MMCCWSGKKYSFRQFVYIGNKWFLFNKLLESFPIERTDSRRRAAVKLPRPPSQLAISPVEFELFAEQLCEFTGHPGRSGGNILSRGDSFKRETVAAIFGFANNNHLAEGVLCVHWAIY